MSAVANHAPPAEAVAWLADLAPAEHERAFRRLRNLAAGEAPEGSEIVGRRAADLLAETPESPEWLVPGVLAAGWMVKLAAREKVGKGTLAYYVFGCLERGEATVFGPAAREKITTLIYTEEPIDSTRAKVANARLERSRIVFGWELQSLTGWKARVDRLVEIAEYEGHGLIFVDNVSRASGVEEEAGVELARAAEYLSDAAKAADLAVWIDHHHKKGAGKLEDKSRGGTALAGACDNNVEMERVGDWDSRVRRLSSRGRLSSTVWQRQIALSSDGTSYESVADDTQPQTVRERARLRTLSEHEDGMTASEFSDLIDASDDTARRVLDEFVVKGWATCDVESYPKRWHSTGEGLDGPVALDVG